MSSPTALDPMKKEYDFSKGERGKFYRPGGALNIPAYPASDSHKSSESVPAKSILGEERL